MPIATEERYRENRNQPPVTIVAERPLADE
jgi:hypothetical protein